MELELKSKREHCPACDATAMHNLVLIRPGGDVDVFVECVACGSFVARYTLKDYTCEDPYRSFLRQMRRRRLASGSLARQRAEHFKSELNADYARARELADAGEETRHLEELLDDLGGPATD